MSVAPNDVHQLEKLLHGVRIPPQPEVLVEIDKELRNTESDLPRIAHLIRSDVSLSAGVLKVVNSAQFGLRARVQSVHQAVTLLGLGCLRNILSAVALKRSIDDSGVRFIPRYWDSAVAIATAAMEISRRITRVPPDEAYTLGLFCDAGIPLLAGRFPDYMEVLKRANTQRAERFTDKEEAHYQTNHAVVGFYLASSWHLSRANREAINRHHNVDEILGSGVIRDHEVAIRLAILKLAEHAEHLSNQRREDDLEWSRFGSLVIAYLGISEPDLQDLQADLVEQLQVL